MPARIVLYNLVLITLGLLTLPWTVYQLVFVKKRREGLAQRFGRLPRAVGKTIWCHAVSVGEVRAAAPLLALLQEEETAKDRIVLSTVTATGQEAAHRECGFASSIIYFPLDLPFVVSRAVRRVNPELFITAETEIWPNLFYACFKKNVPVIVVNGRISDTSFSRYMRFRWFFGPLLQRVSLFLMQSGEDARRIMEMGADRERVKVTGNMKYDRQPDPVSLPLEIRQWSEKGLLLVAGSTHSGEETILLDAVAPLGPDSILLAIVPRHPERFEEVARLLSDRGLPYTRFTEIEEGLSIDTSVVLVDAMGVLEGFYALGDIAFVGGSLVPVGGHNLLEPAMYGIPVLTGPYLHNFRDIAKTMMETGGCLQSSDSRSLSAHIKMLLIGTEDRRALGKAARRVYESRKGASSANFLEIRSLISDA